MNLACLAGGIIEPMKSGGAIAPLLASTYPVNPATAARKPIAKSNFDMGRTSYRASILLREPALAANASRTPRNAPIHQVAMMPQPSANNVGDSVENTGG